MAVGASFLAKMKLAVGLTASLYDTDVTDDIEAARAELTRVGVDPSLAVSESTPLITRAVKTFVQSAHAEDKDEAERLSFSFEKQIVALTKSTGYGSEVAADEV
jgi:hypothetical protein